MISTDKKNDLTCKCSNLIHTPHTLCFKCKTRFCEECFNEHIEMHFLLNHCSHHRCTEIGEKTCEKTCCKFLLCKKHGEFILYKFLNPDECPTHIITCVGLSKKINDSKNQQGIHATEVSSQVDNIGLIICTVSP
jgi:hypothetical protein